MELGALVETLDALVASEPGEHADASSIETLHRQLSRLEAFVTAATGAFESGGSWSAEGAQSASSWLTARCRVPRGEARRRLRLARALPGRPHCTGAWLAGEIHAAHVSAICGLARDPASEAALARDEALLVEHAKTLGFSSFCRSVAYWAQLADPDGTEELEALRRARRRVVLSKSFDGCWLGSLTLDPIAGAVVAGELARLEADGFEADWAEAKARLTHDPTLHELARSAAQRRADALVEMATRSRTCPGDGRRPAPLFSVLVGYETIHGRICQLAEGTVVSPGSLLAWLDRADIERAVFDPPRRVEVGATARLFTGATRRAIELRDQACTHPLCEVPAPECQVDHIVASSEGGPTTQENGRLLCGFHNRLRNGRPPPGSEA